MTGQEYSQSEGKNKVDAYRRKSPFALRRMVGVLLLGIIVCAAIIAVVLTRQFCPTACTSPGPEQPATPLATVEAFKKEELELTNQLVEDFPRDPATINLLANVHNNHGNRTEAVRYWKRVVLLDPNNAAAYDSMARVILLKEEHAKAIQLWQKALQIDPGMFGVHFRLAQALMATGQPEQAITALKKDLEISPKASWSYYLLGQLYTQLKDYEQAKLSFKAAIQIQPGYSKAYYGLAAVCMRLEQTDEARKFMDEFKKLKAQDIRVDKDRRSTYDDLETIRSQVAETCIEGGKIYYGHRNAQKAEQLWQKAAALDPKNIACRTNLATLYQQNNRVLQALELCEQLRELEPDNPTRHFNVGILNARLKKFEAAEKAFQKACELAPQQSDGYRMLAQMYLETGRSVTEALALALKAVQLEPKAENYFVLGAVYAKNDNHVEALAALQRAISLDPNNPKYRSIYELFKKRVQKEN
ncbi:MAG: tetratricopeptide repeat protein [Planctomycetota bacterium]|jgi:tetratricopeptide (TPR) repeat protein